MSVETIQQPALHPLPNTNRADFLEKAQNNMEAYGSVPQEIGRLIVNHVVDDETRAMAYQVRSDYLAGGSDAAAFTVSPEDSEGQHILTAAFNPAVKFDHPASIKQAREETDERLEALWRARNVPGHVRLTAADRDKGLVIATKAPGKGISRHEGPIEPTPEHWKQLKTTGRGMRRNFVGFDPLGGNVNWDSDSGFTVYDTHPVSRFNPRKWVRPRKFVKEVRQAVQRHNDVRTNTGDWI